MSSAISLSATIVIHGAPNDSARITSTMDATIQEDLVSTDCSFSCSCILGHGFAMGPLTDLSAPGHLIDGKRGAGAAAQMPPRPHDPAQAQQELEDLAFYPLIFSIFAGRT